MSVKGWNVAVLVAIGAIWFCGTTQREKPVVGDNTHTERVSVLESKVAAMPQDTGALRELAQAYLDAHQPGMAVGAIDRASLPTRQNPNVEHLYARALLEQGRSQDALVAENHVIASCNDPLTESLCSTWLIASATRRAGIMEQLVVAGIEDANAQPEASNVAYHNATRQVSLAVSSTQ